MNIYFLEQSKWAACYQLIFLPEQTAQLDEQTCSKLLFAASYNKKQLYADQNKVATSLFYHNEEFALVAKTNS